MKNHNLAHPTTLGVEDKAGDDAGARTIFADNRTTEPDLHGHPLSVPAPVG
jgi:hypothetical protein